MLYTRKGDLGDTGLFGCDQRISKSSAIAEALGVLDETNSFLGLCKVQSEKDPNLDKSDGQRNLVFNKTKISDIIHQVQENLFIIQSQVAGSNKKIKKEEVKNMEKLIGEIEDELPEIKSFFISGGTELSSLFDFARTLARRAERRVVAVYEEKLVEIDLETLKYLNRLSSLLYSLARFSNLKFNKEEKSPRY